MSTWPNWVDLVVITLFLRACYVGFSRGVVWAILSLVVVVSASALTLNYAPVLIQWLAPWVGGAAPLVKAFLFWVFFLSLLLIGHLIIIRITAALHWERLHWIIQGLGAIVGGIRGFWWAAFVMVVLSTSGFVYLGQSVEQESVFGQRFLGRAHELVERVANYYPGTTFRGQTLMPPIKPVPSTKQRPKPSES